MDDMDDEDIEELEGDMPSRPMPSVGVPPGQNPGGPGTYPGAIVGPGPRSNDGPGQYPGQNSGPGQFPGQNQPSYPGNSYAPGNRGTSMSYSKDAKGQNEIHFKIVEGEYFVKGKRRSRASDLARPKSVGNSRGKALTSGKFSGGSGVAADPGSFAPPPQQMPAPESDLSPAPEGALPPPPPPSGEPSSF